MKIVKSIRDMQSYMFHLKKSGKSIGFVPTMGYLHEGHQQLMTKAREENDIVVTSIFVNPLQFGPNEDYERYPRDEVHDTNIAEKEQVDILFYPHVNEMYPKDQTIKMTVHQRVNVLCGQSRPGHFDGVVTILAKLFNIVYPDYVYFGMKDAQQVAVVDALVQDYNFPVQLRPIATVREQDGLAKSSRNVNLSNQERNEAPYIYQALLHGQELIREGEHDAQGIIQEVSHFIHTHTHGKIDYVDLLSYPDLERVNQLHEQVILAVAVYFKHARLIDNVVLDQDGSFATAIV
ncbi:pantoate--beta-alanine ligase [Pontibacillus yanchengensis]|uniref:Pantoate--beta-alanine ligase n=2 Tax=Pontibacillus yanchengensis TaxID=462910 RepID=A0ACC7VJM3_9BACI|nr:pantoate--beta-alanine ligase [Pontibacillus yanchengensis]MYL32772.1 pantoate--beta-alanine ligase [Pontibacillus yanchengensis]MYL55166.1 pantoate--beta-alanine ligase [Pontibacillus yanchengensis]